MAFRKLSPEEVTALSTESEDDTSLEWSNELEDVLDSIASLSKEDYELLIHILNE